MKPGRACPADEEVQDLKRGMDFREPRYRREVFLRFYEFHARYRSHPGCVYYLMPELAESQGWDMEQRLWFAFINGNTQNPVTSWLIFRQFPTLEEARRGLPEWFAREHRRLAFDSDRRHHKQMFVQAIESYAERVRAAGGKQYPMFERRMQGDPQGNFRAVWELVFEQFFTFGRLSAFSYIEYLRCMGLPLECDQLFLHLLKPSKSHRNGLAKVCGRDDLDWHDSNPLFDGRYTASLLEWLIQEGEMLLAEAQKRMRDKPYGKDIGYFTLESTLCTYKSWHRPNRRYPNVYNDMLRDRIVVAERAWDERLDVFWQARKKALPAHLRIEDNPYDPGVHPLKQNHYRLTGEVPVLGFDYPCFWSSFDESVKYGEWGTFRDDRTEMDRGRKKNTSK